MAEDLVALLAAAPMGAALLAALELEAHIRAGRMGLWGAGTLDGLDPDAVAEARLHVARMPAGDLLALAVEAGESTAGPWSGDAPRSTARVLRDAPQRSGLAEAVIARLGERLHAPLDRSRQLWWWSNTPLDQGAQRWWRPLGHSPRRPYSAWVTATLDGLWTSTQAEAPLAVVAAKVVQKGSGSR